VVDPFRASNIGLCCWATVWGLVAIMCRSLASTEPLLVDGTRSELLVLSWKRTPLLIH
jgi:hypothetical protein